MFEDLWKDQELDIDFDFFGARLKVHRYLNLSSISYWTYIVSVGVYVVFFMIEIILGILAVAMDGLVFFEGLSVSVVLLTMVLVWRYEAQG